MSQQSFSNTSNADTGTGAGTSGLSAGSGTRRSYGGTGMTSSAGYMGMSSSPSSASASMSGGTASMSMSRSQSSMAATDSKKISGLRFQREFVTWHPFRQFVYNLVESKYFGAFVLIVIFLNTVLITLQMDPLMEQQYGWYISTIDNVFLGIYVFEMLGKLFALRRSYFQSGWNLFDMFIVFTSFLEYIKFIVASFSAFDPKILRFMRVFRSVRALRALRVLRTISFLKSLQIIVFTLLKSIPALISIAFLLFLVMYIFAVIGKTLYEDVSPAHFSNIYVAIFTLFQLITLDDWFGIYESGRDKDGTLLVYLLIFILLETFIFINLFIAVIVNNLQALTTRQSKTKLLAGFRRRRKTREKQRAQEAADRLKEEEAQEREREKQGMGKGKGRGRPDDFQSDVNIRRQQLEMYYYMLIASLENNMDFYESQQHTINELVDLLKPKAES